MRVPMVGAVWPKMQGRIRECDQTTIFATAGHIAALRRPRCPLRPIWSCASVSQHMGRHGRGRDISPHMRRNDRAHQRRMPFERESLTPLLVATAAARLGKWIRA